MTNLFVLAWGLFFTPPHVQADPFIHFHPVAHHWKATECAVDDQSCLEAHDERVLEVAVMTTDISKCWNAVVPAHCADAARQIAWKALSDMNKLGTKVAR